jgi:hypothetical protein
MAKRMITYFGVGFPPFKEDKLGKGAYTIKFAIKGSIPSLKNSRHAVPVLKEAHKFIKESTNKEGYIHHNQARKALSKVYARVTPNLKYEKWVEEQKPHIEAQREYWATRLNELGIYFPLTKAKLNFTFYFHTNYIIDMISKQESIQDLLTDLKIITDDNYFVTNNITTKAANYKDEMIESATLVSISVKIPKKKI